MSAGKISDIFLGVNSSVPTYCSSFISNCSSIFVRISSAMNSFCAGVKSPLPIPIPLTDTLILPTFSMNAPCDFIPNIFSRILLNRNVLFFANAWRMMLLGTTLPSVDSKFSVAGADASLSLSPNTFVTPAKPVGKDISTVIGWLLKSQPRIALPLDSPRRRLCAVTVSRSFVNTTPS